MLSKKHIFLLVLLTCLAFAKVPFLGFAGDDEPKILNNRFFDLSSNIIYLFDKKYITQGTEYFLGKDEYFSSGEVSYRPVYTFTLFVDHSLWNKNPRGYHVHSLIIHIINILLVYTLLKLILKNELIAFWTALFFAIHPTKVEPVCAISYRHELLCSTFCLLSMFLFVLLRESSGNKRFLRLIGIFVCYFLALFTKESALMLPAIFIAYELLIKQATLKEIIKERGFFYGVLAIITLFYLYVYVFVFPNSTYQDIRLIGNSFATHFFSVFWILARYFFDFIAPGQVTIIPGLYAPPLYPNFCWKVVIGISLFVSLVVGLIWSWKRHPKAAFFLGWFILSYLPVSNILYIANPMAHRFLYFPSIGIFSVIVILLNFLDNCLIRSDRNSKLKCAIYYVFIVVCIVTVLRLSGYWKNNFLVSQYIYYTNPDIEKNVTNLGIEYYKKGECKKAQDLLIKSVILGTKNPNVMYVLGQCNINNPELAENYFMQIVGLYPSYVPVNVALGNLYAGLGENDKANYYYKRGLTLGVTSYGLNNYLEFCLKQHYFELARKLCLLGIQKFPDINNYTSIYKSLIETKENE